jgi:flavin-dependent thymidylate synthase
MDVILAGYTVDSEVVGDMKKGKLPAGAVITPETISAAYARISRYPQPVTELRRITRADVEATRQSNRIIVFGMGHHSVAEHVQFNFDIMGISRLALEALETARLCSYTEKSQRYITLQGDFVVPEELDEQQEALLRGVVEKQVQLYKRSFEVLHGYQKKLHPDMQEKKRDIETVEGWAKEDARYALGLCTEAQLGFSGNARNIEYTIRKLRHHRLAEVRELSRRIFEAAASVAPSLIILSDPENFRETFKREVCDDFFRYYDEDMRKAGESVMAAAGAAAGSYPSHGDARLVEHTPEPDLRLCAALLAASGGSRSYGSCIETARGLQKNDPQRFRTVILDSMRRLCEYDPVPREFESVSFTFEIVLSASCFAQLKRHRMMTILKQDYDPQLGLTLPDSVVETGQKGNFEEVAAISASAFQKARGTQPFAAEYFLTNAHRRRVIAVCNLRELYHIARLRMDPHAQWDIQRVSASMAALAQKVAPAAAALACGKHEFNEVKSRFFGAGAAAPLDDGCGLKYSEVPETAEDR